MHSNKILHVIDSLTIGGAETVFIDLIARFRDNIGNNVLILRREKNDETNFEKLKNISSIFILNRKNKFSLNKMYVAHRQCSQYPIIHVHLRHVFYYFYFLRLLFRGKYKLVLHDHEGSQGFEGKLDYLRKKFKPDFYIGVAEKQLLWAVKQWNIRANFCILLVNLPKKELKLREFKIPSDDAIKAVCVGNIKNGKNQLFGIQLAEIISVKIDFIGNIQDKQYYDLLNRINSNNIEFLEGKIIDTEILGSYDLGFCFSKGESGPLVLLEYILAGLPFISFRTGEISERIYKYFPEFFCDNFCMGDWIDRYQIISQIDWKNYDFESRRKVLIDNEFNSANYLRNLQYVYNVLSN